MLLVAYLLLGAAMRRRYLLLVLAAAFMLPVFVVAAPAMAPTAPGAGNCVQRVDSFSGPGPGGVGISDYNDYYLEVQQFVADGGCGASFVLPAGTLVNVQGSRLFPDIAVVTYDLQALITEPVLEGFDVGLSITTVDIAEHKSAGSPLHMALRPVLSESGPFTAGDAWTGWLKLRVRLDATFTPTVPVFTNTPGPSEDCVAYTLSHTAFTDVSRPAPFLVRMLSTPAVSVYAGMVRATVTHFNGAFAPNDLFLVGDIYYASLVADWDAGNSEFTVHLSKRDLGTPPYADDSVIQVEVCNDLPDEPPAATSGCFVVDAPSDYNYPPLIVAVGTSSFLLRFLSRSTDDVQIFFQEDIFDADTLVSLGETSTQTYPSGVMQISSRDVAAPNGDTFGFVEVCGVTATYTPSVTPSTTVSPSPSLTLVPAATGSATATRTNTRTNTATSTRTNTASATGTSTNTSTPPFTATMRPECATPVGRPIECDLLDLQQTELSLDATWVAANPTFGGVPPTVGPSATFPAGLVELCDRDPFASACDGLAAVQTAVVLLDVHTNTVQCTDVHFIEPLSTGPWALDEQGVNDGFCWFVQRAEQYHFIDFTKGFSVVFSGLALLSYFWISARRLGDV